MKPWCMSGVLFPAARACRTCFVCTQGVRHLALEMDSSNKGLKVLLECCPHLTSLHIGSRCAFDVADLVGMLMSFR